MPNKKPKSPGSNKDKSIITSVPPPSSLPSIITAANPPMEAMQGPAETPLPMKQIEIIAKPEENVTEMAQPTSTEGQGSVSVADKPSIKMVPQEEQSQSNWLNWMQGTVQSVSSKVAEKARSSMDTVITTLDPQMKQFINTGGDLDIVVASDKDDKIVPIRQAFQEIFKKACVKGMPCGSSESASQPVGLASAQKCADERINYLRTESQVHPQQPVVAIEGFVTEMAPDCWFEMSLLLLDDPWHDILLQVVTQATPLPDEVIKEMKEPTPSEYMSSKGGFAITTGQAIVKTLQIAHSSWHEELTSVSRRATIHLSAKSLAGMYHKKLPKDII